MPGDDATIRMTVDSGQAMAEQQKYLRSATETFNTLQQKSEAYAKTLQERVKFMERELSLQRENIRLSREQQMGVVREEYVTGRITRKQAQQRFEGLTHEEQESTRELQETTRLVKQYAATQERDQRRAGQRPAAAPTPEAAYTSTIAFQSLLERSQRYVTPQQRVAFMQREIDVEREAARENRETRIRRARQRYREGDIGIGERETLIGAARTEERESSRVLKETGKLLKDWVGDQRDLQRKSERWGESMQRSMVGMFSADTAQGVAGAAAGGGLLKVGGILGILAGILITKGLRGAATMEPAIRDYAILMGRNMAGVTPDVKQLSIDRISGLGMKPSDYYTQYAQYYRAAGGSVNEGMLGIMSAQKALGLAPQQVMGLMGLERYGEGKITPLISFFERYLRDTSQKIAVLPEILQTFSTEATAMLRATGRVDAGAVSASVSAISRGFGLQGEPLGIVATAMRQGLQQSNNPVIQALQYQAMSRAMPGKSLWQMEMAMESPWEHPTYITGYMNLLKRISGGDQGMYARSIYNAFGQYGISKNIADVISRGQMTPEMITKEMLRYKETGVGGFEKEAVGVTGGIEKLTARLQGEFEQEGFGKIEKFTQEVNKLFGPEGVIKEGVREIKELKDKVVAGIEKWESKQDSLIKYYSDLEQQRKEDRIAEREQRRHIKQIADSLKSGVQ